MTRYDRTVLPRLACAAALFACPAMATAKAAPAPNLRIAIGGDLLGPYHSVTAIDDAGFREVLAILRTTDAGFANQEGSIFDAAQFKGYPSAENNGLPLAPREIASELKAIGVNLMSKANNHAADWGLEELIATEQALDAAGIAHSGSGDSDTAARAATFAATAKGKIGLISLASTFQSMARPADATTARGSLRARPGIASLRLTTSVRLSPTEFAAVGAMTEARGTRGEQVVTLGTQTFVPGTKPGFTYALDPRDATATLAAIDRAAAQGGPLLVSIHAHETDTSDPDDPTPPDFLINLAHKAIDHGASAFIRHGPHGIDGIEIYKGRPIFHGVGSLFFDFGGRRSYTVPETGQVIRFPDTWFEGMLATLDLRQGRPVLVTIHPLVFDDTATAKSGLPRVAHGADATRILQRVQRLSLPYGTRVTIAGDIATIALDAR